MNPSAQQPPKSGYEKQLQQRNQSQMDLAKTRHPLLPKNESVTGHPMLPFGDDLVIVYNPGPDPITLMYDKRDYLYPANTSVTISSTVAYFHFGVIAENGHLERPKGPGTYAEDRFSSYCPLFLWQSNPEKYEAYKDWYYNKLRFKSYRPKVEVSSKEFDEIPGEAIA